MDILQIHPWARAEMEKPLFTTAGDIVGSRPPVKVCLLGSDGGRQRDGTGPPGMIVRSPAAEQPELQWANLASRHTLQRCSCV